MEQDLEQKLKHIEDKIDAVRKEVRSIRIRMIVNAIISILVIVLPLSALIYFLPTILNNFLSLYLPPDVIGSQPPDFKEQLRQFISDIIR